ncbi:MAG: polysaccharide lyase [Hyphomicrobium sp.]|mgnify:CR=1 FL=1
MSTMNWQSMAIPAAGVALGGFLFLYVIKDTFTTVQTPPCSGRFPSATEFNLTSGANTPVTAVELQARAGVEEWGVLENAKVSPFEGAPSPLVLKVRLPKGSSAKYQADAKKGGLSFRWMPKGMEGATSSCLRYSVYLPAGFDFGSGGELPGIFGGKGYQPASRADGMNGLASRLTWGVDGSGELSLQAPNENARGVAYPLGTGSFNFRRERWVSIEQETVLNTPGSADGVARLWVDGDLKIENTGVVWRQDATLALSGIVYDVWYGGAGNTSTAPSDTYLALSPATISWK